MNDLLTKERFNQLLQGEEDNLVSLYMPAHRIPNEAEQDPIRLKNLLDTAEAQLRSLNVSKTKLDALLDPARRLAENALFWQNQSDGLAIFLSAKEAHILRLPLTFDELVVAGAHWHIKPLFELLTGNGRFYLLALSQNEVRLLEGTRDHIDEVALDSVPASLAEALRFEDPERQLQFHSSEGGRAVPGSRAAIFHGHGVEDEDKDRILRYFHLVDDGLHDFLHDTQAPLVLAGVDYLLPIYREANSYPHLMEQGVTGNPEHMRPEELHAAAWPLVEPRFRAQIEAAKTRYRNLENSDQVAASLEKVVTAAYQARVDTLFVARGEQAWGEHDPGQDRIVRYESQKPGARDLLDYAAIQTYHSGGAVYLLPAAAMPTTGAIGAILRF